MNKNQLEGVIVTVWPANGVYDLVFKEGVKRFGNCTIVTTRLQVPNPPRKATPIVRPEPDTRT